MNDTTDQTSVLAYVVRTPEGRYRHICNWVYRKILLASFFDDPVDARPYKRADDTIEPVVFTRRYL